MGDLYTSAERASSILGNTPGKFKFNPLGDSSTNGFSFNPWPVYRLHDFGVDAVTRNSFTIEFMAKKYSVDPDIVKSIIYLENSQGYYDSLLQPFGLNKTIRPMNIDPDMWGGLLPGSNFDNPVENIEAGVILLSRIIDRLDNPTVEDIATLYNSMARDQTTEYGYQAESIYEEKIWEEKNRIEAEKQLNSSHCFTHGVDILMADGSKKAIETLKLGEYVLAFDSGPFEDRSKLKPGKIVRLFKNESDQIVDFFGVGSTLGHLYLTNDGIFRRLDEVLKIDGIIVRQDGSFVRARTNMGVETEEDRPVKVAVTVGNESLVVIVRAGVPYGRLDPDGPIYTLSAKMAYQGYFPRQDGLFENQSGDVRMAAWEWGDPREHPVARDYVVDDRYEIAAALVN